MSARWLTVRTAGGLAERAGLQPGDRILKVNGDAFSAERLPPALSRGRPDILEVRRPLAPPSPSAAAGDDAAGGATAAGGTASSANKAASGKGSSATSSAAKRPPSAEPPPPHQGTAESTRAVVRVAAGRVEARWVATPCVARPTDVVVATLACAVSGGDVRAWQGQQQGQRQVGGIGGGGMIGEVVGEVVAVGSAVRSLKRGDMVALAPPSPSASQKASLAAAEAAEAAVAVVGAEEEAVVACQVGVLRVPDGERRLLKAPPNKGPPSSGTSTGTASGTRGRLTAAELLLASGPGAVGLAAADAVLGSTGGGGGSGGGGGFTYAVVGLGPTGLMAVASLLHRCRQAGKGGGAAGSKGGGAGGSVVVLGVDPLPHRRAAALALGATAAAAPEAAAGMLRDLISGEHGGGGAGDDDEVDWSSPENNDGARGGNGDGAATACGCDGVVEASGKAAGVALAVELLAYGGKLACVARHYDGGGGGGGAAAGAAAAVSLSVAACVDKAATVVFGRGSAHGSSAASNTAKASSAWSSAAAEAVEIAASGGFGANLEALVSHRLPLEEAQAAYQLAASGDGLRVMLYPSAPHAAGGGGGAAATGAAHGASAAAPKAVASPAMLASLD